MGSCAEPRGICRTNAEVKEDLHGYLLGLVKHSTATHLGCFGEVFGRPSNPLGARFSNDAGPAAEFWVTPDESSQDIVTGYQEAWEFSDATISELALDSIGQVWWWGDDPVTLHHISVHVTADTQRSSNDSGTA